MGDFYMKWVKEHKVSVIVGVLIAICIFVPLGFKAFYHISNRIDPWSIDYVMAYEPGISGNIVEIQEDYFVIKVDQGCRWKYDYDLMRIAKATKFADLGFSQEMTVGTNVSIHFDGNIKTEGEIPQIDMVYTICY